MGEQLYVLGDVVTQLYCTQTTLSLSSAAEPTVKALSYMTPNATLIRCKQTVAGPTAPLQITDGTGSTDGNLIAWYSIPLTGSVTVAGAIVCNVYALESSNSMNVGLAFGVYRCDGNGAVLSTVVAPATNFGAGEVSTGYANVTLTATAGAVADTAFAAGDLVKVALFIDDAADQGGTGNMAAGGYARYTMCGNPAVGQSYLLFTEDLPGLNTPGY